MRSSIRFFLPMLILFLCLSGTALSSEMNDAVLIGRYDEENSLDAQLFSTLMEQMGVPFVFCPTEKEALFDALADGQIDMALSIPAFEEEREGILFSLPYYQPEISVVTAKENPIAAGNIDWTATPGVRVGVIKNSMSEEAASLFNENKCFETSSDAMNALLSGEVDILLLDNTEAAACADAEGFQILDTFFTGIQRRFALRESDQEAMDVLEEALAQMKESGLYEEILGRFFPPDDTNTDVAPAMPLP